MSEGEDSMIDEWETNDQSQSQRSYVLGKQLSKGGAERRSRKQYHGTTSMQCSWGNDRVQGLVHTLLAGKFGRWPKSEKRGKTAEIKKHTITLESIPLRSVASKLDRGSVSLSSFEAKPLLPRGEIGPFLLSGPVNKNKQERERERGRRDASTQLQRLQLHLPHTGPPHALDDEAHPLALQTCFYPSCY